MAFTRTQIGIAVGAGALLVLVFVGYLWWLSNQGPVLARSEDHDPLTGLPVSIKMNPLRDRSTEKAANKFLRELRDGHCDEVLSKWEHDYHKKYAKYICKSEAQHPLLSWELVDWEEAPAADHSSLSRHASERVRRKPGPIRISLPSPRSTRAASGWSPSTTRCTEKWLSAFSCQFAAAELDVVKRLHRHDRSRALSSFSFLRASVPPW